MTPMAVDHLFAATAAVIEQAAVLPDIGLAAAALSDVEPLDTRPTPSPPTVRTLLDGAPVPEDPALAQLLTALRAAADHLHWVDPYADHDDLAAFRAGYFATTLIGPAPDFDPLAPSTTAAVFFTVQGPELLYPSHSHPAPELYCAVAGTADWQRGDEPFMPKPPGAWMVHPSGMTHAMRTRSEPLVALAVWTDHLTTHPTIDD